MQICLWRNQIFMASFFPWKAAATQNSSSENCVVDFFFHFLFIYSFPTMCTHMVQLVHSALSERVNIVCSSLYCFEHPGFFYLFK